MSDPFHPSTMVWFEDGNIILEADVTRYRVHKGVLVKHSSVFHEILSIPMSLDQELYDGVPVVRLPDFSGDVEYLLRALYESSAVVLAIEYAAVVGILKLSAKYDIPHLHHSAIAHLSKIYPTTLAEWDQREKALSSASYPPFAVLELAHSMDIPHILPAVFYDCSTQTNEALVNAISGSAQMPNLRTCLDARQALLEETLTGIYGFLREGDLFGCKDSSRCSQARLRCMKKTTFASHGGSPLAVKVDWTEYEVWTCLFCFHRARTWYLGAREKLWNDLPSYFNLPTWDQLQIQH